MHYDIVIAGAGPAGMTAAIYAKRANLNVLMLDRLAPGGQIINTSEIQNYTGAGTINGAELAFKMFEHTLELGIEMEYATVTGIQDESGQKRILCLEDGCEFTAEAVIIATGTKPRALHVPGEDRYAGSGISWCAICDGPTCRNKDVVVIGGGNSAVEEALYLSEIVKSLTIITLFDLTADPIVCDKLRLLDHVSIYTFEKILEFYGGKKIKGVRFQSTLTPDAEVISLDCDGAFEYIGQIPVTKVFQDLGILDDFGYVITDDKMNTSQAGIFGAGDCIVKHLRQVITACSDGAIAAQEAAKYIKGL